MWVGCHWGHRGGRGGGEGRVGDVVLHVQCGNCGCLGPPHGLGAWLVDGVPAEHVEKMIL